MARAIPAAAILARYDAAALGAKRYEPNALNDPPDKKHGRWVVIEFPGGVASQITIGSPGNNLYRDDDTFMTHVMVPAGEGSQAAREFAEQIATLYRGQTFGGVTCLAPYPPAEDTGPNGNWYGVSFSTPFKFDLLG